MHSDTVTEAMAKDSLDGAIRYGMGCGYSCTNGD